jgi:flagellar motility protein MotE (MotC chaperone)
MDYQTLDNLRRNHPAWRLLLADHAPLVVSFLFRAFIEPNLRSLPQQTLAARLDDHLYHLRDVLGADAFPKAAREYLDDWAADERGWLRKYYPPNEDEPHYDLTPATEKAIDWLAGFDQGQFVGTESKLMSVFEILRQIARGTEADPRARIADLEQRRAELDAEIQDIRDGKVVLMDATRVKDRFLQMANTARALLSDFREVEQNFRDLDRSVRERIATWEGGKGALLEEVFGHRDSIAESDQGRSFRAFWNLLMSPSHQDELSELLSTVFALEAVQTLNPDRRLLRVHYDWLEAGESTQRTVARLSGQLRRYLDDQAWLENKRIMQLIRGIEQQALEIRERAPAQAFMSLDEPSPKVDLSLDRPLYRPPLKPNISDQVLLEGAEEIPIDALFNQTYVDKARLSALIRRALQTRKQISLTELVEDNPLEQGLAELVAYLSIAAEDRKAIIDDEGRQTLTWMEQSGNWRQATLPQIIFSR